MLSIQHPVPASTNISFHQPLVLSTQPSWGKETPWMSLFSWRSHSLEARQPSYWPKGVIWPSKYGKWRGMVSSIGESHLGGWPLAAILASGAIWRSMRGQLAWRRVWVVERQVFAGIWAVRECVQVFILPQWQQVGGPPQQSARCVLANLTVKPPPLSGNRVVPFALTLEVSVCWMLNIPALYSRQGLVH